jgi:hypothetical protein
MSFVVADIADEEPAASLINGGGVGSDRRTAQGRGCEPRIDEAVKIENLIDCIAANLPLGDRPAAKSIDLDGLAQPPAGVGRCFGSS